MDAIRLIVGLGNPGPRYARTRHNAGFLVVDELARRLEVSLRKGRHAEEAKTANLMLIKPQTYMNLSGTAVLAYSTQLGLRPENILAIHDDLDLPLGRLRFKTGGGAGGQRGVADMMAKIGAGFHRLKIGIGRPPEDWEAQSWVLSRFREEELALVEKVVVTAADAVEVALEHGLEEAKNRYNGLDLAAPVSTSAP